jgi:probable F420-dependent oxidoreductase
VFCFTDALTPAQLTELAQQAERLGYAALWYPEVLSYESFALGSFLLHQTETLIIAAGIANIYARDATTARQGQHTLAKPSGGRFLLGLGVSHVPLVEAARGHQYRSPVATMRAYLDAMDTAVDMAPPLEAPPPIVLAALGPQMTTLAAAHAAGAFPYNVTPAHTALARAIVGPDKRLCVEQKVLMSTDAATAREVARQTLAFYLSRPNYRNNWQRLGLSEADLADGGSERFLDAMVAWGDVSVRQQRLQAHFEAGASHVCIQALRPDGQPMPDWNALTALAPLVDWVRRWYAGTGVKHIGCKSLDPNCPYGGLAGGRVYEVMHRLK